MEKREGAEQWEYGEELLNCSRRGITPKDCEDLVRNETQTPAGKVFVREDYQRTSPHHLQNKSALI